MNEIIDRPRTLILNGHEFVESDIAHLKAAFPLFDMVYSTKVAIRKDPIMQKALKANACVCAIPQATGDVVVLSLSQVGRTLLGKF